jgi:hypothetical protein
MWEQLADQPNGKTMLMSRGFLRQSFSEFGKSYSGLNLVVYPTFNKKWTLFTSTLDLELRKKLVKCYIWSIDLYGAETWTVRAIDQKHLESFEMWCWRRIEKISWTDHLRNEGVLPRIKEQKNVLHEIGKRKANWIGHILRRNCLLQQVIEGKMKGRIEVTGRRGRRRRKLLDDRQERKGYSLEGGSSRSHYAESSLCTRLWTCRKTDY